MLDDGVGTLRGMQPVTFPLDRRIVVLSVMAWLLGAVGAALTAASLLLRSSFLPLLGVAFVVVVPGALACYAVAGTAGRRSLFALAGEHRGARPSDAQVRRFQHDVDPWGMFWLYTLITAAIVGACSLIAAIAIAASGGEVTELLVAIAITLVSIVVVSVSTVRVRAADTRGDTDAKRRDLVWPLPASSELLATLRSRGGDSGMSGPL